MFLNTWKRRCPLACPLGRVFVAVGRVDVVPQLVPLDPPIPVGVAGVEDLIGGEVPGPLGGFKGSLDQRTGNKLG